MSQINHSNITNEATFVHWNYTLKLCGGVIGFLSNGLLIWLLTCGHGNERFTANYIKINLAIFQMLYDLLIVAKSILVLQRELGKLEKLCTLLCAKPAGLFLCGTILNHLLLALNHYCLHNSCRKNIYMALLTRRNTMIAIAVTWLLMALVFVELQQNSRRLEVSAEVLFLCRGPLPNKHLIPIIALSFIALLSAVIINYRIYKSVTRWLKKHTVALHSQKQVIARVRLVRSAFIITLCVSAHLGLFMLLHVLTRYYIRELLFHIRTMIFLLFTLTVQLNALIVHVLTDCRSRRQLWNLIPWRKVNCERMRRRVRVGVVETDGLEPSSEGNQRYAWEQS